MQSNAKIFVAGHRGMVGSALVRRLQSAGYSNVITRSRQELDLLSQQAVHDISIDLNSGAYTATPRSSGVTVNFTCNNGTTVSGQNVYAVGSISQLGSWAPAQGFKLNATNYPSWKGSITVPANTAVQWKCVKFNGSSAVWQGGSNNSFTTPATGSVNATASF